MKEKKDERGGKKIKKWLNKHEEGKVALKEYQKMWWKLWENEKGIKEYIVEVMELEMEFETEKDRIGKQEGVNKRLHGVAGTLLIYIYIYI